MYDKPGLCVCHVGKIINNCCFLWENKSIYEEDGKISRGVFLKERYCLSLYIIYRDMSYKTAYYIEMKLNREGVCYHCFASVVNIFTLLGLILNLLFYHKLLVWLILVWIQNSCGCKIIINLTPNLFSIGKVGFFGTICFSTIYTNKT